MPDLVPSTQEVRDLVEALRRQRERLATLIAGDAEGTDLAQAVDDIGEQLLVADEELRAQNEQLAQSTRRLDLLVAAHEELFANAPTAYLQTDADGLIIRLNRAARRLLGLPAESKRSRTLANLLVPADRPCLRGMIAALHVGGEPFAISPAPLEATLLRPDGIQIPVLLAGRRSSDGGSTRALLHWEIQERAQPAVPPAAASGEQHVDAMQKIADAARDIAEQDDPADALQHLVKRACEAVPGCDEVGITLVRSRGRVETPAATGELAAACDHLQYRTGEGPGIAAIGDSRPVQVPDMDADRRWPRFGPQAAALGVGSMLAVPLVAARGVSGALNFYATSPKSFDDDALTIGEAFAIHAGIALAHAELEANLRTGMATREEIGRAVGILMERHRVNATSAFDMLVYASQHSHRKLRDVAARVCETGEDPTATLRR